MLEWALLIGMSINDPNATEIARFASERECRRAEMVIWHYGEQAANERGKDQPADLYAICKHEKNGDRPHTWSITE